MKVYLCGPINGCTDEECKVWRNAAIDRLGEDNCINPMRNDWRGQEDEKYVEIVETDLDDISKSDLLLVNAPDASWGTGMEIREAFTRQLPVIVVHPKGMRISPWLRYHSTKLCTSFEEAFKQIEDWQ